LVVSAVRSNALLCCEKERKLMNLRYNKRPYLLIWFSNIILFITILIAIFMNIILIETILTDSIDLVNDIIVLIFLIPITFIIIYKFISIIRYVELSKNELIIYKLLGVRKICYSDIVQIKEVKLSHLSYLGICPKNDKIIYLFHKKCPWLITLTKSYFLNGSELIDKLQYQHFKNKYH
jgi:hypothetical protein